jgi:hypothetical protein
VGPRIADRAPRGEGPTTRALRAAARAALCTSNPPAFIRSGVTH